MSLNVGFAINDVQTARLAFTNVLRRKGRVLDAMSNQIATLRSSAQPACGDTWTSQPGNSSNPPPTIPEYIAVIVAGSIRMDSSAITGDVKKIIVVRTNPGYGPSPSHPGTGQVVAVLCGPTNQTANLLEDLLDWKDDFARRILLTTEARRPPWFLEKS